MQFIYEIQWPVMFKPNSLWCYEAKTGRLYDMDSNDTIHQAKGLICSNWIVANFKCIILDVIEVAP